MDLFGQIDCLEVGREGTHQPFRTLDGDAGEMAGQLGQRGGILATANRRHPDAFHFGEKFGIDLLGENLPDHGTEPTDIVAQRVVRRRKVDFAQGFGGRESIHRYSLPERP